MNNNIYIKEFQLKKDRLQILVNYVPCYEDYIYKRYGDFYYGEINGFVSVFQYQSGTTRGFAGREKTLKFDDGSWKTFKGSLWDPDGFTPLPEDFPEYINVSITDEEEPMKIGHTFYGGRITKKLFDELTEQLPDKKPLLTKGESSMEHECDYKIKDLVYHIKRDDDKYRIVKAEIMEIKTNSNGTYVSTKRCDINQNSQEYHLDLVYKTFEEARKAILDIYLERMNNTLLLKE